MCLCQMGMQMAVLPKIRLVSIQLGHEFIGLVGPHYSKGGKSCAFSVMVIVLLHFQQQIPMIPACV